MDSCSASWFSCTDFYSDQSGSIRLGSGIVSSRLASNLNKIIFFAYHESIRISLDSRRCVFFSLCFLKSETIIPICFQYCVGIHVNSSGNLYIDSLGSVIYSSMLILCSTFFKCYLITRQFIGVYYQPYFSITAGPIYFTCKQNKDYFSIMV